MADPTGTRRVACVVVGVVLVAEAWFASPIAAVAMLAALLLFPAMAWFVHSSKDRP